MAEAAALLSLYFAFAALHGAEPRRRPPWLRCEKGCGREGWRASALLATAVGVRLLTVNDDLTAALLTALAALAAIATLFVLLVPVFPKTLWALAVSCPPMVMLLMGMGERRG